MKNWISLPALALMISVLTSCCKIHPPQDASQTITATINKNQSFQFDLGTVENTEGISIIRQASHYSISQIESGCFTSDMHYTYTPAKDFTGSDEVTITLADEKEHACNGHHSRSGLFLSGHHDKAAHEKKVNTYIFKITIADPAPTK
jgi:hypothetical protein